MFKQVITSCEYSNIINTLILITSLFVLSACGGGAGTAVSADGSNESSGLNATQSGETVAVDTEESSPVDISVLNDSGGDSIAADINDEVNEEWRDVSSEPNSEAAGTAGETISDQVNAATNGPIAPASAEEEIPEDSNEIIQVDFIELSWEAPASDANGSALTDITGYMIHYRKNDLTSQVASINAGNVTYATVNNLSSGTWCFVVTAYNSSGRESAFSNYACKDI